MKTLNCSLLILAIATGAAYSQGTLVYDQQSSTDENYFGGGGRIQFYGTVGQSFTPSLSTVGFFRVKLGDIAPGNALGATLVINLRSNAINGPILGTTTPVVLADGFNSSVNFLLPTLISVVPSTMYFFQVVVQSGDNVNISIRSDLLADVNYPGGTFYGGAFPSIGEDLWFREGVPEPTSASLLFLGGGLVSWFAARKRRCV